MPKTHYEVIGVSRDASMEEIISTCLRIGRACQPDENSTAEERRRFEEIREAYLVLSDPQRRKRYEELLESSAHLPKTVPLDEGHNQRMQNGSEEAPERSKTAGLYFLLVTVIFVVFLTSFAWGQGVENLGVQHYLQSLFLGALLGGVIYAFVRHTAGAVVVLGMFGVMVFIGWLLSHIHID